MGDGLRNKLKGMGWGEEGERALPLSSSTPAWVVSGASVGNVRFCIGEERTTLDCFLLESATGGLFFVFAPSSRREEGWDIEKGT